MDRSDGFDVLASGEGPKCGCRQATAPKPSRQWAANHKSPSYCRSRYWAHWFISLRRLV